MYIYFLVLCCHHIVFVGIAFILFDRMYARFTGVPNRRLNTRFLLRYNVTFYLFMHFNLITLPQYLNCPFYACPSHFVRVATSIAVLVLPLLRYKRYVTILCESVGAMINLNFVLCVCVCTDACMCARVQYRLRRM